VEARGGPNSLPCLPAAAPLSYSCPGIEGGLSPVPPRPSWPSAHYWPARYPRSCCSSPARPWCICPPPGAPSWPSPSSCSPGPLTSPPTTHRTARCGTCCLSCRYRQILMRIWSKSLELFQISQMWDKILKITMKKILSRKMSERITPGKENKLTIQKITTMLTTKSLPVTFVDVNSISSII